MTEDVAHRKADRSAGPPWTDPGVGDPPEAVVGDRLGALLDQWDRDELDVARGLRRLRSNLRRLRDDPSEVERVEDIADLAEADDNILRSAMARPDDDNVVVGLRQLAQAGHVDAMHLLAEHLVQRSSKLRREGRYRMADEQKRQADELWRLIGLSPTEPDDHPGDATGGP